MNNLQKSAIWYARHGWSIFPLRPRTKEPYADLGVYNATSDVDQVWAWWKRWPDSNIGLHCGASDILTLDADLYKDNYAGDSLLTPHDEDTLTNLTGNGGTHLLYRMPESEQYGNKRGSLPLGIDVRGYGGYIVLPPSIHPDTGIAYQWEAGYGPHEIEIAPLPTFLKNVLDTVQQSDPDSVKFGEVTNEPPNLRQWRISRHIWKLIHEPPAKGGRSEADQAVISSLVLAGATNDDILNVFEHYPIGQSGKYADKGTAAQRYLANSVSNARSWAAPIAEERKRERAAQFMQMAAR